MNSESNPKPGAAFWELAAKIGAEPSVLATLEPALSTGSPAAERAARLILGVAHGEDVAASTERERTLADALAGLEELNARKQELLEEELSA